MRKREDRVLKKVLPVLDNVKGTQGESNKGFRKLTIISQLAFKLVSECTFNIYHLFQF